MKARLYSQCTVALKILPQFGDSSRISLKPGCSCFPSIPATIQTAKMGTFLNSLGALSSIVLDLIELVFPRGAPTQTRYANFAIRNFLVLHAVIR